MEKSQQNLTENGKIVFEINSSLQLSNSQQQSSVKIEFPIEILNFNIELLNNNHEEPYPIPREIVTSTYPFEVMKQFLQAHQYSPKSFKVAKPINSKHYHQVVDEASFKVCSQFTNLENAQKATQVIILCQFIRFHQLKDAVCAAVATNYYIPPNDQKELADFKKKHNIDISSEETCEIIKEYEELLNIIEVKAKQDLLRTQQQLSISNS